MSGLALPVAGLDASDARVDVAVSSAATGAATWTRVRSTPTVAAVAGATLALSRATRGAWASVTASVNVSAPLARGAVLEVALPGFDVDASTFASSGAALVASTASSLTVAATEAVAKTDAVTLSLNATLPAAGVDATDPTSATVDVPSVGVFGAPVTLDRSSVGLDGAASISFGSSDFGYARIAPGDSLQVRFPPSEAGDADGLSSLDAGAQYKIGGALMTVAAVDGDVVTLAAPQDLSLIHI